MAKMTRRERERERHRLEILEASCEVFSKKGYRSATIADISKRSEFSIASIYKHFESKEDIYHSLIEDTLQMLNRELEKTLDDSESPLAQIRQGIDTILNMMHDNRAFLEFLVGEYRPSAITDEGDLARKSMDSYREVVTFFAQLFEKAIAKGEVADFDPIYLTIGLLGNIFTFTSYWIYFQDLNLDEVQRNLISDIFFSKIALD